MKKIGIITFYFKCYNYGAQLQARALVEAVKEYGYDCEQICYDASGEQYIFKKSKLDKIKQHGLFNLIINKVKYEIKNKREICKYKLISDKVNLRKKRFDKFINDTSHSEKVYNQNTISECCKIYDAFITGSDQVFNLNYYNKALLLEFVHDKDKISYAASIGDTLLAVEEDLFFKQKLDSFKYISVREKSAEIMLNNILDVPKACTVLDPTLLVPASYWVEMAYGKREIEEKYLFCYFLGDEISLRSYAEKAAELLGLKLVTIKHTLGKYQFADTYPAYEISDDSPYGFNAAIAYADFVITDSFHGTAFSVIHNKKFLALKRNAKSKDGSDNRIIDLLSEIGIPDRWQPDVDKIDNAILNKNINYNSVNKKIEEIRCKSQIFLKNSLNNME